MYSFCFLLFIFESGSWYVAQACPEYPGHPVLTSCHCAWCDTWLLHATIELFNIQCLIYKLLAIIEKEFVREITEQNLMSTEVLLLCKLVCLL